MAVSTNEDMQTVLYKLGPWLIGSFGDMLLQGVLFCQFSYYIEWSWDDKLSIRLQVIFLAVVTTLKSIQCFATMWIMFVLHFSDVQGSAILDYTVWWQKGNNLMVATVGLFVQAYFCNRLLAISKNNWFVVTPIIVVLIFAYIAACVMTYYISEGASKGDTIGIWNACHMGSVFAGDLLITISTAYFLLKTKKDVLPQTAGMLNALIRLTISTSAPASLCAMISLVLIIIQVKAGTDKKVISTAFTLVLCKLYAFSMMWTLNARHSIRNGGSGGRYTSDNSSSRKRENTEMNTYNGTGIQVMTHVETAREIDVHFHDEVDGSKTHGEDDSDFKPTTSGI